VSKPYKTRKKWGWLGNFKPNVRKIKFSIFSKQCQINTKYDRTLKTAKAPSWVVL